MSESSGLSPEIAEHLAITISDARSASGAFKALISATDSSAHFRCFLFPPPCLVSFLAAGKTTGPCLWTTAAVAGVPSNGSTIGGGVPFVWWSGEAEARQ